MRMSIAASCFFVIGILVPVHDIHAQTSQERILKEAESHLRKKISADPATFPRTAGAPSIPNTGICTCEI